MRKFLSLMLAVLLCFGFLGCSNTEEAPAPTVDGWDLITGRWEPMHLSTESGETVKRNGTGIFNADGTGFYNNLAATWQFSEDRSTVRMTLEIGESFVFALHYDGTQIVLSHYQDAFYKVTE